MHSMGSIGLNGFFVYTEKTKEIGQMPTAPLSQPRVQGKLTVLSSQVQIEKAV